MDSEGTIKVIYYIACREKNITFSAVTEIHKALWRLPVHNNVPKWVRISKKTRSLIGVYSFALVQVSEYKN